MHGTTLDESLNCSAGRPSRKIRTTTETLQ